MLDIATREVLLSRNVVFYEKVLPYNSLDNSIPGLHFPGNAHGTPDHTPHLDDMDQLSSTPTPETTDPPQDTIRSSQRTKKPPAYLVDYHCNQATTSITHSHHSQVVHPISKSLSYVALSPSHRSYSSAISAETEPSSYEEATKYAC